MSRGNEAALILVVEPASILVVMLLPMVVAHCKPRSVVLASRHVILFFLGRLVEMLLGLRLILLEVLPTVVRCLSHLMLRLVLSSFRLVGEARTTKLAIWLLAQLLSESSFVIDVIIGRTRLLIDLWLILLARSLVVVVIRLSFLKWGTVWISDLLLKLLSKTLRASVGVLAVLIDHTWLVLLIINLRSPLWASWIVPLLVLAGWFIVPWTVLNESLLFLIDFSVILNLISDGGPNRSKLLWNSSFSLFLLDNLWLCFVVARRWVPCRWWPTTERLLVLEWIPWLGPTSFSFFLSCWRYY